MCAEFDSVCHESQFQTADSLTGHESGVNKLVLNLQAHGEGKSL